jgi:hypothetical protein
MKVTQKHGAKQGDLAPLNGDQTMQTDIYTDTWHTSKSNLNRDGKSNVGPRPFRNYNTEAKKIWAFNECCNALTDQMATHILNNQPTQTVSPWKFPSILEWSCETNHNRAPITGNLIHTITTTRQTLKSESTSWPGANCSQTLVGLQPTHTVQICMQTQP